MEYKGPLEYLFPYLPSLPRTLASALKGRDEEFFIRTGVEEEIRRIKKGTPKSDGTPLSFLSLILIISASKTLSPRVEQAISYLDSKRTREFFLPYKWELAKALGLDMREEDGLYAIHVSDYLRFAPAEKDYRLVYTDLREGYVYLDERKLKRFFESAHALKIMEMPQVVEADDWVKEALRKAFPVKKVRVRVSIDKHPPCMEKILSELKEGKHISHYGRWTLAIYLKEIGVEREKIIELFSNLPDFKERITRYHVNYVFEKGYSMPSCKKIQGYGLCVANCGVKNPMELLRRGKDGRRDKEKS